MAWRCHVERTNSSVLSFATRRSRLSSQPIAAVARELNMNDGTLANWASKYRSQHADDDRTTAD